MKFYKYECVIETSFTLYRCRGDNCCDECDEDDDDDCYCDRDDNCVTVPSCFLGGGGSDIEGMTLPLLHNYTLIILRFSYRQSERCNA